jgi:putative ABC transport system substrate-binding protein
MTTKLFTVAALLLIASVHKVFAEPQVPIPRVLLTRPEPPATPAGQAVVESLRQGLSERGYVDGQNIALEVLWSAGDADRIAKRINDAKLPKVNFIVTSGTASTRLAKKATATIPIIMATTSTDPVNEGFAASYARPGANITGLMNLSAELAGKRLELLKEAAPKTSRVALLLDPTRSRAAELKETQDAGRALGVQVQAVVAHHPDEFANVFQSIKKNRADGLIVVSGGVFNANRPRLIELATKSRRPAMYSEDEYVNAGGLMVYAAIPIDQYRRAAVFIDKILKGAKPGDLPIEQPMKFEFIINLKTAKQIGLSIPPNVLARADRVIR